MGLFQQQFEEYDAGSSKRLRKPNVRLGEWGYYTLPFLMEKPLKRRKKKLAMDGGAVKQPTLNKLPQGVQAVDGFHEVNVDSDKWPINKQFRDVFSSKQSSFQINAGFHVDDEDFNAKWKGESGQGNWKVGKNNGGPASSLKRGKQGRRARSTYANISLPIRKETEESPFCNPPNAITDVQEISLINQKSWKFSDVMDKSTSDSWDQHLKEQSSDARKDHSSNLERHANRTDKDIRTDGESSMPYTIGQRILDMDHKKIFSEITRPVLSSSAERGHTEAKMGLFTACPASGQIVSLADGVQKWLDALGMSKYSKHFELHEVDENVLPLLTLEDLREMGIAAVGSRRKIFSALQSCGKKDVLEG